MERSESPIHGSSAVFQIFKFILFVLIFVMITLGIHHILGRFLNRTGGLFGASEILDTPDTSLPKRIVVLDAGHGGEDGGASAGDGTLEKDLNLSTALILADHLRACGIDVILTRDTDRLLYDPTSDYQGRKKMLDLKARLDIAEKTASEHPTCEVLFVSIHMNSYPAESVKGFQVWYSPNDPASEGLASAIQGTANELLKSGKDRSVKKAGSNIYLLDRLTIPSVLVECGFLSNAEEAALLSTEAYQRELAFAIFAAIMNYSVSDTSPSDGSAIAESIVPLTP